MTNRVLTSLAIGAGLLATACGEPANDAATDTDVMEEPVEQLPPAPPPDALPPTSEPAPAEPMMEPDNPAVEDLDDPAPESGDIEQP